MTNSRVGKTHPKPPMPINGYSFEGQKGNVSAAFDVKPLPEGFPFKNVFLATFLPPNENDITDRFPHNVTQKDVFGQE